jgi:hypothetical protein
VGDALGHHGEDVSTLGGRACLWLRYMTPVLSAKRNGTFDCADTTPSSFR